MYNLLSFIFPLPPSSPVLVPSSASMGGASSIDRRAAKDSLKAAVVQKAKNVVQKAKNEKEKASGTVALWQDAFHATAKDSQNPLGVMWARVAESPLHSSKDSQNSWSGYSDPEQVNPLSLSPTPILPPLVVVVRFSCFSIPPSPFSYTLIPSILPTLCLSHLGYTKHCFVHV